MRALQAEATLWTMDTFGSEITGDKQERALRFLEEALELVQSCGITRESINGMADYVYNRPVGEPTQEVGGTLICLCTLSSAHGIDAQDALKNEIARAWANQEKIRQKHAGKPQGIKSA